MPKQRHRAADVDHRKRNWKEHRYSRQNIRFTPNERIRILPPPAVLSSNNRRYPPDWRQMFGTGWRESSRQDMSFHSEPMKWFRLVPPSWPSTPFSSCTRLHKSMQPYLRMSFIFIRLFGLGIFFKNHQKYPATFCNFFAHIAHHCRGMLLAQCTRPSLWRKMVLDGRSETILWISQMLIADQKKFVNRELGKLLIANQEMRQSRN